MPTEQIIERLKALIQGGDLPYDDMGYCIDCREFDKVAHDASCVFLAICPSLNDGAISLPNEKAI